MRKKEEIQESGSKFADGLLMPIIAVGSVFLFIILAFYAYDSVMKNKNNNEIVVLDGNTEEFKVAPQDPGGMEVQHKDKEVFNTVSGEAEVIEEENLNIQQQEQPVSKEEISQSSENEKIALPAQAGEKSVFVIKPKEAPKFDESLVVNKDNKIIEMAESKTQNAIEEVKKQAEAQAEIDDNEAKIISDEVVGLNAAETEKSVDDLVEVKKAEPEKLKAEVKSEVKAEVTKVKDSNTGENKTIVMFKDKPKSLGGRESNEESIAVEGGKYYVQVSSHTSEEDARNAWNKISSKYKSEISGYKNNITKAEVGGKTFFRLSFGPFNDRANASTSCGILKAKGQDCIIQRY